MLADWHLNRVFCFWPHAALAPERTKGNVSMPKPRRIPEPHELDLSRAQAA